mmetsp:Transcript_8908/g.25667  ORF Transcript_8908/g.25667 Transcript_8908/m.25667 type:complete len:709 (-) Transcript_8908:55-2181(-)|eukprot:CAMPEP_0117667132 /NCGR_PEP_ID=MMETSP0804-20121206/10784_1 /TAXON_ID=1074897 /ORGANISM="Tetraselmis astigmatica, Strain CCMP880" /LENGTH=708 /DNA_ID=CAMNT_0005474799 /DNA_START=301 /DNA_END=2427 /DNA_ORIENTATION=-
MGGYLSQPVTEKNSSEDENSCFQYGACAMQGWRPEMEDAHTHHMGLGGKDGEGIFGVFDGHGGQEVAIFCAKHLMDQLTSTESYKKEDYRAALYQTFLRLDSMVADEKNWPELRQLAALKQEGSILRIEDSELPDFLNRAMIGSRHSQSHRYDDDDIDDEDEMEDEVGDPNFAPEYQEESDAVEDDPNELDKEVTGDGDEEDDGEGKEEENEESEVEDAVTDRPHRSGGSDLNATQRSTVSTCAGEEPVEEEDAVDEEPGIAAEGWRDALRPRPIRVDAATSAVENIEFCSPRWSDGYYSDDYEEYSDDDFDSYDDSGELSTIGKRLNSPLKRPKSKDGKRARGSRPGTSDSRPKSAPASRPASQAHQRLSPSKSMRHRMIGTPTAEGAEIPSPLGDASLSRAGREAAATGKGSSTRPQGSSGPNKDAADQATQGCSSGGDAAALPRGEGSDKEEPAAGSGQPNGNVKPENEGVQEEKKRDNAAASSRGSGGALPGLEEGEEQEEEYGDLDDLRRSPSNDDAGLPPGAPSAGCTAVVAMVAGDRLLVANAGDSRCVCSKEGEAVALSEDHKPDDPEELARIIKAGGFVAQGRINGSLNLSRAVGDLEFKLNRECGPEEQAVTAAPDVREVQLEEGYEFLVLACDGIWDVMSNQEVVTFVRTALLAGDSPKQVCEKLCDTCLAPDTEHPEIGCDNMSAMVVLFKKLWVT